jgi:hypothetical protein
MQTAPCALRSNPATFFAPATKVAGFCRLLSQPHAGIFLSKTGKTFTEAFSRV